MFLRPMFFGLMGLFCIWMKAFILPSFVSFNGFRRCSYEKAPVCWELHGAKNALFAVFAYSPMHLLPFALLCLVANTAPCTGFCAQKMRDSRLVRPVWIKKPFWLAPEGLGGRGGLWSCVCCLILYKARFVPDFKDLFSANAFHFLAIKLSWLKEGQYNHNIHNIWTAFFLFLCYRFFEFM